MSFTGIDPARLFQILNNTGLQNKDNQLYQLLFNLIQALTSLKQTVTNGSGGGGGGGGGTVINNFNSFLLQQLLLGLDDGQDGDTIPGPTGARGLQGLPGPPSLDDCCENEDWGLIGWMGGEPFTLFTLGSIPFSLASGEIGQDNAQLFWDNVNKRLGIGTNTPTNPLNVRTVGTPVDFVRNVAGTGDNRVAQILSRDTAFGGGTPTNNDSVEYLFRLKQADGTYINLAGIRGLILDVTNNVATGALIFCTKPTGNPGSVTEREVARLDDAGNFLCINFIKSNGQGGIGYATGAGGSVTQNTNKTTAVTLDKICGTIIMNNANLNSGAGASFLLNSTQIGATDNVVINVQGNIAGVTANAYSVFATDVRAGLCTVRLTNFSGSNLAEPVQLTFSIIKAVAA